MTSCQYQIVLARLLFQDLFSERFSSEAVILISFLVAKYIVSLSYLLSGSVLSYISAISRFLSLLL
jgi:hypothetical protein